MTETPLTREQAKANAGTIVGQGRVLADAMQRRIDEFRSLIDSMETALTDDTVDPRAFTDAGFAIRLLEQIESITHIHTGSSDHSAMRTLRDSVIKNATGDPGVARGW